MPRGGHTGSARVSALTTTAKTITVMRRLDLNEKSISLTPA